MCIRDASDCSMFAPSIVSAPACATPARAAFETLQKQYGVTASFAMLGDLILAEPRALKGGLLGQPSACLCFGTRSLNLVMCPLDASASAAPGLLPIFLHGHASIQTIAV